MLILVELLTITVSEMIVLLKLVELLTITVLEMIVCFADIGGIVDHHCFRGDCLFCIYWWNC